ncbi:MAG: LamG-like jellyroll fold domain-containing protein, partial [Candidatus Kariarchaeaceae archaeon]
SLDSVVDDATLSIWINWVNSSDGDYQRIMASSNTFPDRLNGMEWSSQPDGDHFFYPWSGNNSDYNLVTDPFTDNQWQYTTITMNYTAKEVKIYIDGNSMTFTIENVPDGWTQLTVIDDWLWGGHPNVPGFFAGTFDEIRVLDTVRSESWIVTEYNNQFDPSSFYSIGPEMSTTVDITPPVLNDFGLEDLGTGTGTFWTDLTDDISVNNVTLQINSTTYDMIYNGSLWIYQLGVTFDDYYTYQIINSSDTSGNFLSSPSLINNHTFNIDNTAPSVVEWIYDETIGYNGTFRANVTDSWGNIDTVYVTVTSCECINSNIAIMQLNGTEYINNSILMKSGTIFFEITANDTYNNIFTSSLHSGNVANKAPTVGNLTFSPVIVTSNDSLTLNYDFSDIDDDLESGTEIRWYKNNILQSSLNDTTIISSSVLFKGDQWHTTVKPKDGALFGNTINSSSIIIGNTIPEVSNVQINPSTPINTTALSVSYDFSDLDSDSENTGNREIRWYKNGFLQSTFNDLLILPNTATTKGEIWNYIIRVHDGTDYSNWVNSTSVVIANSTPTASDTKIINQAPQTTDDLIANWTYDDIDLDPEDPNWIISWYKNDILQGALNNSKIVLSGNTSKTDIWYFKLQVYDGTNYSIVYQSSNVQILNTAPTASNINITQNPTTLDQISASWTFNDIDGDSPSGILNITWYKNGIHQPSLDNSSSVNSGSTTKGEIWHYLLQVYDGEDFSLTYNSSDSGAFTTIINSSPMVSNIDITSTPKTFDDLVASWTYNDADGDVENTSWIIHWYKNGALQSAYDNLTTVSSSATVKGEMWNYTLQVYDSEDYSTIYNSS